MSICGSIRDILPDLWGVRYLILDILGQGTFGQVVKCQNMKTHEIVAVKVIKNKPAYFNQSMMEVTILEMVSLSSIPFPVCKLKIPSSLIKAVIHKTNIIFFGFAIHSSTEVIFASSSNSCHPISMS